LFLKNSQWILGVPRVRGRLVLRLRHLREKKKNLFLSLIPSLAEVRGRLVPRLRHLWEKKKNNLFLSPIPWLNFLHPPNLKRNSLMISRLQYKHQMLLVPGQGVGVVVWHPFKELL
jgi:hypothetical protein